MKKIKLHFLTVAIFVIVGLNSCVLKQSIVDEQARVKSVSSLKFLDEYELPYDLKFNDTWIGGLSGIDYDSKNDSYYLICDDPSQFGLARFYKANIVLENNKIDTIIFNDVKFLQRENGLHFTKPKLGDNFKADAESIRFNPQNKTLVWGNEGERLLRAKDTTLINPSINTMTLNGDFLNSIKLPKNTEFKSGAFGPRRNGVFEGLTFANNYKYIIASMELPLFEDGEISTFENDNSIIRLYKFDTQKGENVAQYAYRLNAMPSKPTQDHDWNVNGISEILAINENEMMLMERAWGIGYGENTAIRIYIVDLRKAENQIENKSFQNQAPKTLAKRLVFDSSTLNISLGNFEGMTFGPKLSNGNQSLILCVDNNFSKDQKQQFLLLEVLP